MTPLGAIVEAGGTRFRVWAPHARKLELEVDGRRVPMTAGEGGYWETRVEGVGAGARYLYVLDGERKRPDPVSRFQPEGVHGPSEVVDPGAFAWQHAPVGRTIQEYVIYELHVGTFTPEGTFDAAAAQLGRLTDLGVTAVELMPVGAFPGTRNWGYDGVHWSAPQASYGGPDGLRRFVDACHRHRLHAILDVVYNHLGPEGNYLAEFAPYFTHAHTTPWGDAIDYALPPVREHVQANARLWLEEYRFDALRLDAVHAIVDDSPRHIVAELCDAVHALGQRLGRRFHVIAESDLGDARVIEAPSESNQAWGCDAQWADDLHHALHAVVTGERQLYYADFGGVGQLARAIEDGFVYTGQVSRRRGRPFGTPAKHLPGERFVVCAQNHDQIGNRAQGERLGQLVPGCEHAVAAVVLSAPAVPLLFMGEEHADPAPFLYFTDHGDPALQRAVSEGRRRELGFGGVLVPDPQAPETFERSRIDLALGEEGRHAGLRRFYRALLQLRRDRPSLKLLDKSRTGVTFDENARTVLVRRWLEVEEIVVLCVLSSRGASFSVPAPHWGKWRAVVDAGDPRYGGPTGVHVDERDGALEVRLPGWGALICANG